MRKIFLSLLVMGLFATASAQSCHWVFLTDKAGATFDPYNYFDAKAIGRYRLNHADLYDSTNFPLNGEYVKAVCALATEEVGQSRWFNAVAVTATDEQVAEIARLPFVRSVRRIEAEARLAGYEKDTIRQADSVNYKAGMTKQLLRMQGELFREKGIDGRGIRIAVFDAGFPRVNTHVAFKHLRDSNRIVGTWNFPKKKADVYGWNDHGLNVLSCITGVIDTMRLGLATGAEFLLARTEVESEPFKEEVWWMQAMEWADKNGADIISSSLGYGKSRYKVKDMDGSSLVARAANMAARKGMLVCTAAGNEADDDEWKIIVTPADADSVLTVGGIIRSEEYYEHVYFSSYGPTADGRMKPNVCNIATVFAADNEHDSAWESYVQGTSFSTPLTAGFCACAWQLNRSLTAMQLKAEVEKSADLYPYYDYALGYGVPQASWFTDPVKRRKETTFVFGDSAEYILFKPLSYDSSNFLFLHVRDSGGLVEKYKEYSYGSYKKFDSIYPLLIPKSSIGDRILCVCYNGYVSEIRLNDSDRVKYRDGYNADEDLIVRNRHSHFDWNFEEDIVVEEVVVEEEEVVEAEIGDDDVSDYYFYGSDLSRTLADNKINWWAGRYSNETQMSFGTMVGMGNEVSCRAWSPNLSYSVNYMLRLFKPWYRIGAGYGISHTNFNKPVQFGLGTENTKYYRTNLDELYLQLYQRIRFVYRGRNGLFWDFGVYGSFGWTRDKVRTKSYPDAKAYKEVLICPDRLDDYRWNYGLMTGFSYNIIGLYARYRMNGLLGSGGSHPDMVLPRLSAGIVLYMK